MKTALSVRRDSLCNTEFKGISTVAYLLQKSQLFYLEDLANSICKNTTELIYILEKVVEIIRYITLKQGHEAVLTHRMERILHSKNLATKRDFELPQRK